VNVRSDDRRIEPHHIVGHPEGLVSKRLSSVVDARSQVATSKRLTRVRPEQRRECVAPNWSILHEKERDERECLVANVMLDYARYPDFGGAKQRNLTWHLASPSSLSGTPMSSATVL
jgi:hypothetical protein